MKDFSDDDAELGVWREAFYYLINTIDLGYLRCITFLPSNNMNAHGSREHRFDVQLAVAALFKSYDGSSYRLYVHGEDVPNVGDLPRWVPLTESVPLFSGRKPARYRITARRKERVSVRRRPCSSRPGYSLTQCLKECQWRRVAAHTGCRLPHMVAAGVFLPRMEGFMDHLPLCPRLLNDGRCLTVRALIKHPPPCIEESKALKVWHMYADYHQYANEQPFTKKGFPKDHLTNCKEEVMQGNMSSSTPTQRPTPLAQIPIPPPLPQFILPPNAFVNVPKAIFNVTPTGCRCPLACQETVFTLTQQVNDNEGGYWNTCYVFFSLAFDFTEEIVQEWSAVLLADLLASIGGFIGLFTGVSLYTFVMYADEFIETLGARMKMWGKMRKKHQPAENRRATAVHVTDLEEGK